MEARALTELLDFHARIRLALDALDALAAQANAGSVDPLRAQALADFFAGPLVWHDIDEELSLMPRLRKLEGQERLQRMIVSCARTHDTMESRIDASLPHLRSIGESQEPASPMMVRKLAGKMRQILVPHLEMEEKELFPMAQQFLDAPALEDMAQEMERRHADRKAGGAHTSTDFVLADSETNSQQYSDGDLDGDLER